MLFCLLTYFINGGSNGCPLNTDLVGRIFLASIYTKKKVDVFDATTY